MSSNNFEFPDYSSTAEREIAVLLGRVTHHIHPEVCKYITEHNIAFQDKFKSICHRRLKLESFFYKGSDCVFPGVRRPINSEKQGNWKNKIFELDGTILNDNTYPRHIWAYLAEHKGYSGGEERDMEAFWLK